nr:hypothetical protein [Tanacetum cinerariifolium]
MFSTRGSNELFQKLLKDLKELAEYDQSTNTDRPIFLNNNHPENSTEENVVLDIHKLIEECSVEVPEKQKQNMEDTMFDLVKICHHKQFLCIHDDIDNLIESALNSKLLLINSINSQLFTTFSNPLFKDNDDLDSSDNESLSDEDVPAEEFKIYSNPLFDEDEINSNKLDIHQLNKTSEENVVLDIHQLIEECSVEVPEKQKQNIEDTMFDLVKICHHKQFLCIHDDIDNLIKSALDSKLLSINFQLAPIQSTTEPEHLLSMGYEHPSITPETESDEVIESNAENLLPILSKCEDNDDLDSSDNESLSDEDVPAKEFKIYSNPLFDEDEINSNKLDPHCFNVESDFVESLLNRDTFIEFTSKFDFSDLFLFDNSIPPGIKNVADDPKENIRFLEEILINDSILSYESSDSNFEDNPSNSRPPPEPLDDNFDLVPVVISVVMEDNDEPDEHFNPRGEIFVSTNNEDADYFPFMFVIQIFLPYLILPEISPLLLSAESEDTIFDH